MLLVLPEHQSLGAILALLPTRVRTPLNTIEYRLSCLSTPPAGGQQLQKPQR